MYKLFLTLCIVVGSLLLAVGVRAGGSCGTDADCNISEGYSCVNNVCVQVMSPVPTTPTSSGGNADVVSLTNPLGSTSITQIIGRTISVVMGIIGSITFVVFVYGGFLWLTSGGNSDKIKKGLSAMLWAGIGIIVVFSSYAIITLILRSLGAIT